MLTTWKIRDGIAPTFCFGLENVMAVLLTPVIITPIQEGVG